jgi:hypothetical protein
MSNLNELLSESSDKIADDRSSYLKQLAVSNVEKHYNNLTSELNKQIDLSDQFEKIGGGLLGVPVLVEGGTSSIKALSKLGGKIRSNIKSRQSEARGEDPSKLEGNTEEDQIRPAEPVENTPDLTDLDNIPNESESFRMKLPSQSERYGLDMKPQTDLKVDTTGFQDKVINPSNNNTLNHVDNANNDLLPESNTEDLTEAKRGLKTLKDSLPETEELEDTTESTATSIFEGIDLGAAAEGFVNPILDIAGIGAGIGTLVAGIFEGKKKRKEEEVEKEKESEEVSKVQNQPDIQSKPFQLTAANETNQSQISQSATTSF